MSYNSINLFSPGRERRQPQSGADEPVGRGAGHQGGGHQGL